MSKRTVHQKATKPEYGLKARAFKPWRRWAVDNAESPLLRAMKPGERAFLEQFNREYYDADFRANPLHNTDELRRSCYRSQNYAYQDVMSRGAVDLEGPVYARLAEGHGTEAL